MAPAVSTDGAQSSKMAKVAAGVAIGADPEPNLTRLPKTVVPKRYELKLDVFPEEERYTGVVNVRLFFYGERTRTVWLHSVGLDIIEASIRFSQFALPDAAVTAVLFACSFL